MMYRMLISPCAMFILVGSALGQVKISLPEATPAPANDAAIITLPVVPAAPTDNAPAAMAPPTGSTASVAPGYPIDAVIPNPFSTPSSILDPKDRNFWFDGDFVLGWMHGMNLPAGMVTTSPDGTARSVAGVMNQPGTRILYGGAVNDTTRAGMRINTGYWFTDDRLWGLDLNFFMLGASNAPFSATSGALSILARPYTDATSNSPQAVLIAYPGSSAGSINIRAQSETLFNGSADLAEKTYQADNYRLVTLFGYRFYSYNENLNIDQNILPTNSTFIPGTQIASTDHFATRNFFNGFDLGFRQEFFWNPISLEIVTKIALGRMNNEVSINGNQTIFVPGSAPVTSQGGVYALGSNIGSHSHSHLQTMPEAGAALNWQATSYLQVRVGYSFMLLQGVARAGNQIDQSINPANFTPASSASPNAPTFIMKESDVWIHTVNLGLVFTY